MALREIDDADPALAFSPLVRGIEETLASINDQKVYQTGIEDKRLQPSSSARIAVCC